MVKKSKLKRALKRTTISQQQNVIVKVSTPAAQPPPRRRRAAAKKAEATQVTPPAPQVPLYRYIQQPPPPPTIVNNTQPQGDTKLFLDYFVKQAKQQETQERQIQQLPQLLIEGLKKEGQQNKEALLSITNGIEQAAQASGRTSIVEHLAANKPPVIEEAIEANVEEVDDQTQTSPVVDMPPEAEPIGVPPEQSSKDLDYFINEITKRKFRTSNPPQFAATPTSVEDLDAVISELDQYKEERVDKYLNKRLKILSGIDEEAKMALNDSDYARLKGMIQTQEGAFEEERRKREEEVDTLKEKLSQLRAEMVRPKEPTKKRSTKKTTAASSSSK